MTVKVNKEPLLLLVFRSVEAFVAFMAFAPLIITASVFRVNLLPYGIISANFVITLLALIAFLFLEPLTRIQNITFVFTGAVLYFLSVYFTYDYTRSSNASVIEESTISCITFSVLNGLIMLVESILGFIKKY